MNKADLVREVAENTGLTGKDAGILVQTVLDGIVDALKSGEKVEVRGFGSFRLRNRNPRQRRNPKTGEVVWVPAKRVVHFRLSKDLKDLINS